MSNESPLPQNMPVAQDQASSPAPPPLPPLTEAEIAYQRLLRYYPLLKKPTDLAARTATTLTACASVDLLHNRAAQLPSSIGDTIEETLRAVNSILSRATGAVIYCVAAWDDGKHGTRVFESVSPRAEQFLGGPHTTRMVEQFLLNVHLNLGSTFSQDFRGTWPVPIGLPRNDYRPQMPPEHPELAQEAWVTKEYMMDLAFYQDVRLPSWQEICDDINSGTYALVLKNRIPPQLIPFECPINMPPDRLKILTTWFCQGQQNLDEENTDKYSYVFQWREPNGEESLRLHGATNSILAYDYDSTLYFAATQKFKFTHDTYMSAPSNLPLFDEEAIELLKKYSVSFPDLRKVWKMLEEYEQLHPPKRTSLYTDPMLFRFFALSPGNVCKYLALTRLPDALMHWLHPEHKKWHPSDFTYWVTQTNALIDPATQRAYGGYGGVVRVLFAVILMHLSRQWAAVNVPKIKTDTPDWKSFRDNDQKQLAYLLGWLLQVLQPSIDNSLPVVRPAIMPGHRHTAWPALQVQCSGSIYFNQSVDQINTLPAAGITFMSTDSYGAPSDRFDDVIDVDQLMDDVALSPQQAEPQPAYCISTSSSLSTLTTLKSQSKHPASIGSLKRQSTSAQVAPEIVPGTRCSSSEPSADAEPRRNALDLDVGQPSSTLPSPQPVLHPLPFPSSRLPQGLFDEPHSASTPRPRGRVSNRSAATVSFPEPSLPDLDPPESEIKSR